MKKKIKKFLSNSDIRFSYLSKIGYFNYMSDKKYLKKKWKSVFGYELDLENPKTFNEKLQWLKLYDRKPEYTVMVDKYLVKEYVADKIGEEYIIPTIGVWDDPDDIDFDKLPDKFVLKCNHNSGTGMCICKDKSKLDIDKVKKELRKGLKENYYLNGREWPYKNVQRKIIAEKFMEDSRDSNDLPDYKLMCFDGKVRCSFTCTERFTKDGLKVTFYDRDWKKMPFERHYPSSDIDIEKPRSYDEMVKLAEELSKDIPFSRIDFYEVDNKPYFGEITFFPGSGYEEFTPEIWDKKLGDLIPVKGGVILLYKGIQIFIKGIKIKQKYSGLTDYKFFCFNGYVDCVMVCLDRESGDPKFYFFDKDWNLKRYNKRGIEAPVDFTIEKPKTMDKMFEIASILSTGFKYLRVDLYSVDNKIYFGETTFFPDSGFDSNILRESDEYWGSLIDLGEEC